MISDLERAAAVRASIRVQTERERRSSSVTLDPVEWGRAVLGEVYWSKQREIMRAVRDHPRVAVHSCHGPGKSFCAARIAAWWLSSSEPGEAFVLTSAPTFPQVRAILWREIRRAHSKGRLPGYTNQTEWWLNDEIVAMGRKPADYDQDAFQGIHARKVLVVLDEAAGIPSSLWQATDSVTTTDESRVLAIGNPDDPGSRFAQVCAPGSGWHVIGIDAFETPNFTGEPVPPEVAAQLTSPQWSERVREDYGEDSPYYTSRVRGRFPEQSTDGVIPLSWLRACQVDPEAEDGVPVELGVDVGAGGDETVIRERRGMIAGRSWRYRTPDWSQAVGYIVQAIHETGAKTVKVDVIGIGWGVAGRLRELRDQRVHKADVVPVNVGKQSTNPKRFPNLRSQIWWEVGRELSQSQGWNLSQVDEVTIGQLVAPKYKPDSSGRLVVERKEETIKRIGRSPDDADALLLAFHSPVVESGTSGDEKSSAWAEDAEPAMSLWS